MDHTFHQTIATALDIDIAPGRFVWDAACGGSQWVSLFREDSKSRSARYACADGVLVVGGFARMILEVEEAGTNGFLPTRIAGKLATAALCRYFIAGGQAQPVPFSDDATFVQVVNRAGLQRGSRKVDQYANMERDIQQRLMPLGPSRHTALLRVMLVTSLPAMPVTNYEASSNRCSERPGPDSSSARRSARLADTPRSLPRVA